MKPSKRDVDQYSMTDPAVASCPYAYYEAMRREEPVHRDSGLGFYWVANHDAVTREAMNGDALSSRSPLILKKSFKPRAQALWDAAGMQAIDTLVTSDPPEHDHYRALASSLFTPKKVENLGSSIEALAHAIIDDMLIGHDADFVTADFVTAFAARLPATVMCDEFGFSRAEQPQFRIWSEAFLGLLAPELTEVREMELVEQVIELFKYLKAHVERAAREPTGRVIDVLATMPRRDGTPFTLLERSWLALITFVGGNDTTVNMLAAGVKRLATDESLQGRLRSAPELLPAFIEELLRLDSSVQALLRVAKHDMSIEGVSIPSGANVVLCTASANRDERRWSNPERFEIDRPDSRRHLGFGWGRHSCIGMHLARSELRIAFEALLQRLDDIRLAIPAAEVVQVPMPFHRRIAELKIRFRSRNLQRPAIAT